MSSTNHTYNHTYREPVSSTNHTYSAHTSTNHTYTNHAAREAREARAVAEAFREAAASGEQYRRMRPGLKPGSTGGATETGEPGRSSGGARAPTQLRRGARDCQ